VRTRHPERILTRRRDVRSQALLEETTTDETRHPQFVLDDEHTHQESVTQ